MSELPAVDGAVPCTQCGDPCICPKPHPNARRLAWRAAALAAATPTAEGTDR